MQKKKASYNYKMNILKALIIFFAYFIYSKLITINYKENILMFFIADIVFSIAVILLYKENILKAYKQLKTKYSLKKIVKTIIKWTIIIFTTLLIISIITNIIFPNIGIDNNTSAIDNLYKESYLYAIFKILFFAIVTEELMFRESLNKIVKNDILFIVVSSIVCFITNIAWIPLGNNTVEITANTISNFIPGLLFSICYVKNNRNIVLSMLIKMIYQFIPLLILLATL